MKVVATAPSNIALIKYMGKTDTLDNLPANSSLSWTLEALQSTVEIEYDESLAADVWEPLAGGALELSETGRAKFLKHVARVKADAGVGGFFRVRSANNFPADCGIASSASSFAALTKACYQMFEALDEDYDAPSVREQAEMSRRGSGSSCRSFFAPWAMWTREGVRPLELPVQRLLHQVAILNTAKKEVSSSEAHKRCVTSLLFKGRPQRAEERLAEFLQALRKSDWERAYDVVWAEFQDMHALFETSQPAFGYWHPDSIRVLTLAREEWRARKDGPLVTMDAGANVHLLWREDQAEAAASFGAELARAHRVLATGPDGRLTDSGGGAAAGSGSGSGSGGDART